MMDARKFRILQAIIDDYIMQIPEPIKAERVHRLIAVGEHLATAYRTRLLGTVQPVLLEEKNASGQPCGYTPQYVHVACSGGQTGEIVNVRLTELTKEGMAGKAVE